MAENKKTEGTKKIVDTDLDKVSGGVLFKDFDDQQYNAAGVEIGKLGSASDECFIFNGEKIDREDAGIIVDFYHFFGRRPKSVDEATKWYRDSLGY